jgi:DNA invertase Pin-like site-specific DNA recombinase
VSSTSQVTGDGFERQMKSIEEYAKTNRLAIVQVYKEEGISGSLEARPALAEMLVSLENNGHGVTTVIIEKLERLARDLMVQEFIIRDFQKQGFNIISTMEGADLCGNDPTRKLIRQIMGAFAEYDRAMIVAKLRAARERIKAKTGKCGGRKGYGETAEGQLIIDRIVELRFCGLNAPDKLQKISSVKTGLSKKSKLKKMTYQEIADKLNEEGVLTLDGRTWSLHRVQQTLKHHKIKSLKKLA